MQLKALFFGACIALTLSSEAAAEPLAPRIIAAQVTPAVVAIAAYDQWDEIIGTGTGFLVDDQGTFVTNWHVLEGATRLQVELATGERFSNVYMLAGDQQRDIAILRIPVERTPAVNLGVDHDLQVGDPVFVMGNPLGLDRTFSNGMISARRTIEGSETIQITAPISPGSSGGPVMDDQGRVVGVATWYLDTGQNLNMAVPIRYVRPLLGMQHTPALFRGTPGQVPALAAQTMESSSQRRSARIDTRSEDPWGEQVLSQLAEAEAIFLSEKLTRSHEPVLGELDDGQSGVVSITVEPGVDYLIVGACDEDCDDLDFYLYGPEKELLVQDDEEDGFPMVVYEGGQTDGVTLRVKMYSCQVEPCAFGVVVFR